MTSFLDGAIEVFNAGNEILANALKTPHAFTADEIYNELISMELEDSFLEESL